MKSDKDDLGRGLTSRHLTMISIGGVIGVGMFLGSGATVSLAGPGVIIAYALGGAIMMLVMLGLAEMSVANPVPGSFRVYAAEALGPYIGFLVGWTYWLSWVVVMAAEIIAASTYMGYWFSPQYGWIFGILFSIAMTLVNLRNVESFGEFEFWFSLIKVLAIVIFIIIGVGLIFGFLGKPIGSTNYLNYGGFFPRGIRGLLLSMVMVMVGYGGTEVIGVAAGETKNPKEDVPKAINGIVARTLILYVGSITILVGIIPWTKIGLQGSPFVLVFDRVGIPGAATIMNIVVITAALSGMNSGLYTSSRMLYSLAKSGFTPPILGRVSPKTKVPTYAVLASTFFLYIGVLVYYLSPESAFLYITGISAFGFMLIWATISITHVYYRPILEARSTEPLEFKMPGYPYTSWLAAVLLFGVVITLWFIPEQRIGIYSGFGWLVLISGYYLMYGRQRVRFKNVKEIRHVEYASFMGGYPVKKKRPKANNPK